MSTVPDDNVFQIIEEAKIHEKQKVKAQLPDWLEDPTYFSNDPNNDDIIDGHSSSSIIQLLSTEIRKTLLENEIYRLFPVQRAIIAKMLYNNSKNQNYMYLIDSLMRPQDICVKSPTGSGKTLAYALPIIQHLYLIKKNFNASSIHKNISDGKIKALILLPTKDLAHQVNKIFEIFSANLGIKVVMITGDKNIELERKMIIENYKSLDDNSYNTNVDILENYFDHKPKSKVDIIIATPGRLIDHIYSTDGFDLNNLKYIAIDEADRMLLDIKQDWLFHLERALTTTNYFNWPPRKMLFSATFSPEPSRLSKLNLFLPVLFESKAFHPHATLTPIPNNAKYSLPPSLQQFYMVCPTKVQKPLYLLWLLFNLDYLSKNRASGKEKSETKNPMRRVLCFTKSVESSVRLAKLLNFTNILVHPAKEFSSLNNRVICKKILKSFQSSTTLPAPQKIPYLKQNYDNAHSNLRIDDLKILVCSDLMARGMDLKFSSQDLNNLIVLNYDVPIKIKNYVHRCGRTARAGSMGQAVTFVEDVQLQNFKNMFTKANWCRDNLIDTFCHPLTADDLAMKPSLNDPGTDLKKGVESEDLQAIYQKALKKLKKFICTSPLVKKRRGLKRKI
ncbi:unnamed protein product [Gordionus sp. m RMFG-2023]